MGDKIHYYCLNELLWHSALSAGNLWPQAACPPGASFIDPPEPDRGLRPILLLKLHSIHAPFGHFYTRGLDPFLPTCSPAPEHACNSTQSSKSLAPNRSKPRPESRWAPSRDPRRISGKAGSFVGLCGGISPQIHKPSLIHPLEADTLCPSARKVGRM